MSETTLDTPSLFDAPVAALSEPVETPLGAQTAGNFTRWLFSFGPDFRNSPDLANLRFWLDRHNVKMAESAEREILAEARVLFARRLEQALRKPETAPPPSA